MADNLVKEPVSPSDIFYPETEIEPLEPTIEAEGEEATEDDVEAVEVEAELESEEEAEEDAEELDDESENTYLELNGKEYSLAEVEKWKNGHLMQADYTKKSQLNAKESKALAEERLELDGEKLKVADMVTELEAIISLDETDWTELKSYDPEKYIELKELDDKRKAKVKELKGSQTAGLTHDELLAEKDTLFSNNPDWLKEGELTETYTKDIQRVQTYALSVGYTAQDLQGIVKASHWKALLDASKKTIKPKKSLLEKKIKKAPLVTKPKKVDSKVEKSVADIFYGT